MKASTSLAYIAAVVLDILVLALPLPSPLKAALAPLVAGIVAGLLAPTTGRAILAGVAAGLTTLVVAFLANYVQAPVETVNALNRPGFYSLLPVMVQLVVPLLAAPGTRLLLPPRGQ